jgi:hypothetical protein
VKSKEIRNEHCPTGIMLADYFTEAQQGMLFRQMRDMIMGNTDIALPTDKTVGIPAVSTTLESRSVLGNESEIDRSPCVHDDIAPTSDVAASTIKVPANRGSLATNRSPSLNVGSVANRGPVKKRGSTVSWAEVARIK